MQPWARERGWRLTAAHYRLPGVSAWLLQDRWPHDKLKPSQLALIDTRVAGLQREVSEWVSSEAEHPVLAARVCGATATAATTAGLCASTRLSTNILTALVFSRASCGPC